VRANLEALALDLGVPGPDQVFGAGRVRVSADAPRVARPTPSPLASVRGRVAVRFAGLSRSRIATWTLAVDGRAAVPRPQAYPRGITIDTRHLSDGWHALQATARDWPGNTGSLDWSIKVDNTRPRLVVRRVAVARPPRRPPRAKGPDRRPRTVRVVVALADPGTTGRLRATVTAARRGGRRTPARVVAVSPGPRRTITVGRLTRGAYSVRIALHDRAGNSVTVTKGVTVR
jgi:hypothetical protein